MQFSHFWPRSFGNYFGNAPNETKPKSFGPAPKEPALFSFGNVLKSRFEFPTLAQSPFGTLSNLPRLSRLRCLRLTLPIKEAITVDCRNEGQSE